MHVEALSIPDIKLLTPVKHGDSRGFFSEVYSLRDFQSLGLNFECRQENYSFSRQRNTVRGLHWQTPPFTQAKLIQVVSGCIFDVAVDLRRNSPWYGQHVTAELSADNWQQLLIPAGFAHGFCTLAPDTAVLYKVDAFYSAPHDQGVRWDDPALGIAWPVKSADAVLSSKDQQLPVLADADAPFEYEVQDS
jgi:dTDP-4-dehydrorhamnose 3,5-epimerase